MNVLLLGTPLWQGSIWISIYFLRSWANERLLILRNGPAAGDCIFAIFQLFIVRTEPNDMHKFDFSLSFIESQKGLPIVILWILIYYCRRNFDLNSGFQDFHLWNFLIFWYYKRFRLVRDRGWNFTVIKMHFAKAIEQSRGIFFSFKLQRIPISVFLLTLRFVISQVNVKFKWWEFSFVCCIVLWNQVRCSFTFLLWLQILILFQIAIITN